MILGSSNVSKLMIGTSAVQKVMLGANQVWSAVQPLNIQWLGYFSRGIVGGFTESAFSIGAASADRRIFVGALARTANSATTSPVSAMTIGGVTATKHVEKGTASGPYNFASALFSAVVPTGTLADFVLTISPTLSWGEFGVWAVTGGTGMVSATASDGDRGAASPITCDVSCGTSGKMLACGCSNPAGGTAAAWTGIYEDAEKNTIANDDTATWANGDAPSASVFFTGGQGQYTSAVAVNIN